MNMVYIKYNQKINKDTKTLIIFDILKIFYKNLN